MHSPTPFATALFPSSTWRTSSCVAFTIPGSRTHNRLSLPTLLTYSVVGWLHKLRLSERLQIHFALAPLYLAIISVYITASYIRAPHNAPLYLTIISV
jgi:hypothetical protein